VLPTYLPIFIIEIWQRHSLRGYKEKQGKTRKQGKTVKNVNEALDKNAESKNRVLVQIAKNSFRLFLQ
jgi:hypothetical protein